MKIFSHGILGMNARNLKYIHPKNTGESISLADSKMKTKNFLSGRGIPFAETYAVIASGQELSHFSFDSIQADSFVIKPNYGSKGQGILIVKKTKRNTFLVSGEEWTEDELRLHMTDILSGVFSLYGNYDKVVIEELLRPGFDFSRYCKYGLADIRIIVYNYVPMTAMVRMPTQMSEGKANLAQGGIGLGLNIASGEVMSFFQHKKNYTEAFPDPWGFLKGSVVPFWDKILLHSSQIQFYTGLGYLALDWVVTKSGPKLLEINARAGLEIQNVNLVPLAKRLEQVNDLKIKSPEKGVEVAKALFGEMNHDTFGKNTIHATDKAEYKGLSLTLRVDLDSKETKISPDLKKKITENTTIVTASQTKITLHSVPSLLSADYKNTIIFGTQDLKDCLVIPKNSPHITTCASSRFSEEICAIDYKMATLNKKLNLTALLKPTNYDAELSKFLEAPHHYNPVFEYNFPSEEKTKKIFDLIVELKNDITKISDKNLASLFATKLEELQDRMDLIIAYKTENHEQIFAKNIKLFGVFNEKILETATQKVLQNARVDIEKQNKILGEILTRDQVIEAIERYFEDNALDPIPIKVSSTILSRMAVSYKGNEVYINIREDIQIRKNELASVLAHELGVHLRRYQNGIKHELQIFRSGTGYYLTDEEGLAVYNSFHFLPDNYEKNAMYFKYYLLSQVDTLSFVQSVSLLQSIYPTNSLEKIFAQVARLKRGIIHTEVAGIRGSSYFKDKIYLDGYIKIRDWIAEGGDVNLLYFGKVKISDLPLVAQL